MITITQIIVDDKAALGLRVDLPKSPPLVMVVGKKGFIMCGFLNIDTAEKLGVAAATVSGVKSCEDVLKAEVKKATSKAEALGVKAGMKGEKALQMLL